MECYKTQLFLPLGGDKTIMSTSEMIAVLKESNYQIGDETPANVVEEIYDIHLLGDTKHDELLKQIRFPKLERCLRHAFDNKADTILNEAATFIRTTDEKIGIIINNHVPASMRDKIYDVEACVTKDELIACRCNCQSGGQGKEKVACVHVLPIGSTHIDRTMLTMESCFGIVD